MAVESLLVKMVSMLKELSAGKVMVKGNPFSEEDKLGNSDQKLKTKSTKEALDQTVNDSVAQEVKSEDADKREKYMSELADRIS